MKIIKSTISDSLVNREFRITSKGLLNGLREIQDGVVYFGTGNLGQISPTLEMLNRSSHDEKSQHPFLRSTSNLLSDVVIKQTEKKDNIAGNRIFQIRFDRGKYLLKDCGKLGVFVKLRKPKVKRIVKSVRELLIS